MNQLIVKEFKNIVNPFTHPRGLAERVL